MILRRILSIWVLLCFLSTSIVLPPAYSQSTAVNISDLSFQLPKPGTRVGISQVFDPVLIKGLKVHPENPFIFDFIVDPGNEQLNTEDFKKTSQRLINYFLASLAVPEKDLWVNLSPVEKTHIIPDTLIKTELGRDLLAEDYMLKQIGASLIYPESNLGREFWSKVYDEAYQKFGVTEIPVNVFNKIWIIPQKASVYEKGNSVYIVNAHLKVMLEEDLLAQKLLGRKTNGQSKDLPIKNISKQVLREVVLPAIEKEVNEGKNFAQLRQVFYSLILAQWYQDAFKQSILNKDYSGRNKIAGIDLSAPKNKELIYHQYLAAYKKGVFNYIKEETDKFSQQPVPRKYFSGGFVGQKVLRNSVSDSDFSLAMVNASGDGKSNVDLEVSLKAEGYSEPESTWFDLKRPRGLLTELTQPDMFNADGSYKREKLYALFDQWSQQVESLSDVNPVQSAWPVEKAVALLPDISMKKDLLNALLEHYPVGLDRPKLIDKILLNNKIFAKDRPLSDWSKSRLRHFNGRRVYIIGAEMDFWAGGLGPVLKFLLKGMKMLGVDVVGMQPWYQYKLNGAIDLSSIRRGTAESEIFEKLINSGLAQRTSPTEIKLNGRRTLRKYQVEQEAGLKWHDVVNLLSQNGWAESVGPYELILTTYRKSNGAKAPVYGLKAFQVQGRALDVLGPKLTSVIERAENYVTERRLLDIIGDNQTVWNMVRHPVDYTDPNIGLRNIKVVDGFVSEMGDLEHHGVVAAEAISNPEVWQDLFDNDYIDFTGIINDRLKHINHYTDMVLPSLDGKNDEKERVFLLLKRLQDQGIHQTWVQVASAVDKYDIPRILYRDVAADGFSSYYTKMLYNYKGYDNPVGQDESEAFINTAASDVYDRIEGKRKQEEGDKWQTPCVHAQDGQFGPLAAVMKSRGKVPAINEYTTHTYKNRGYRAVAAWVRDTFYKHMLGIKNRFVSAFLGLGSYDNTRGAIDVTDQEGGVTNTVSFRQRQDMKGKNPDANVKGIANAGEIEIMAEKYINELEKLKARRVIFPDADFERLTPSENALVKIESKQRLNELKIPTANGAIKRDRGEVLEKGDFVEVDTDKPMLYYVRRLVAEKAGRGGLMEVNGHMVADPDKPARALSDDNIWELVKAGYNVVLCGNHQGSKESEKLASDLRALELRIDSEKRSERREQYPGKFQFVQYFTAEEKKYVAAAGDVQVQDSDEDEADGTKEEPAVGAFNVTPNYRIGNLADQGIQKSATKHEVDGRMQWDYLDPDEGNILMPVQNTAASFLDTVFKPLKRLWDSDPEHLNFYKGAVISLWLAPTQGPLPTAASYLQAWDDAIEKSEIDTRADDVKENEITKALFENRQNVDKVLNGSEEITTYHFSIFGGKGPYAENSGLKAFVERKKWTEDNFGIIGLMDHFKGGHYQSNLRKLFSDTGAAYTLLDDWLNSLQVDKKLSNQQKYMRLGKFMEGLSAKLQQEQEQQALSAAMVVPTPGGIKFDNIGIDRQGSLTAVIANDKALEHILLSAAGVSGEIIGMTPITNLPEFIQ